MNSDHNPNGGPRTDAGKEVSSRNAIKHGCCSNDTLIIAAADETIEQFQSLEATWFQAYSPKNELETHLLNQVIQADWFLQRANRTLAKIEADIFNLNTMPVNWNDRDHHAIQRFTRYQITRRNEFMKAKKALDDHRKLHATEQRNEQKQEIAKQRFEVYREKNKRKPSLSETLQELRDNRIKSGGTKPSEGNSR
jgi:adenylate kinase family enzyme